ncbi:putative L,D-transpeptidase YbiS [Nymphon striatum]|nr:putative L,D-transpeptidase YbiS [Nymphon striatum]
MITLSLGMVAASLVFNTAHAGERYATPPPIVLSPDLTSPWVMQLKPRRQATAPIPAGVKRTIIKRKSQPLREYRPQRQQTVATRVKPQKPASKGLNPIYLPQRVNYNGSQKPGTIIIDTSDRFLYLVQSDGTAMRYGVGVGKTGFSWTGTEKITQKKVWPSWRPPAEMIKREKKKGRILPAFMEGGPSNPLGARALYLGSTLYRIHGTNQPWTIGGAVSSGCIRMRNEDVTDLYNRVKVGAKVIVRS